MALNPPCAAEHHICEAGQRTLRPCPASQRHISMQVSIHFAGADAVLFAAVFQTGMSVKTAVPVVLAVQAALHRQSVGKWQQGREGKGRQQQQQQHLLGQLPAAAHPHLRHPNLATGMAARKPAEPAKLHSSLASRVTADWHQHSSSSSNLM